MRRGMPASAAELSYLEKKVLLTLEKRKKATPEELRTAGKFRELVEVMNAASWLQAKGLVTMKERVVHTYRLARPDVAGRSPPGPEAAGRVSVRRRRPCGRPRMASPEGLGGGLQGSPRERRDSHRGGERSGGRERAGRRAPHPARQRRTLGGRDRSPTPARPEVSTRIGEGTRIGPKGDRPHGRGREDPCGRPRTQGGGRSADDGSVAFRKMAERGLPAVRSEGLRPSRTAGETARARRVHRKDSSDFPEHGLHGD